MMMAQVSLDELGPVDYVVVEFPAGASSFTSEDGGRAAAMADSGTIRVIDVMILTKDADTTVEATELVGTPPDSGQVISELITEGSAVTGQLVEAVLNIPPPDVRDVLPSTDILEHQRSGRQRTGDHPLRQGGPPSPPARADLMSHCSRRSRPRQRGAQLQTELSERQADEI
jgi:hypothetical protein